MFVFDMRVGPLHGVTVDVSTVHDFHGSADNPSLNGTLRHLITIKMITRP